MKHEEIRVALNLIHHKYNRNKNAQKINTRSFFGGRLATATWGTEVEQRFRDFEEFSAKIKFFIDGLVKSGHSTRLTAIT